MNSIFLFITVFILGLGIYPFVIRRSPLTLIFLIQNASLAVWNLCFYIQESGLYFIPVNRVSQIQLESILMFTIGLYYLTRLYPNLSGRLPYQINLPLFLMFSYLIFFTDFVSHAELINGELVFTDQLGYVLYSGYLLALGAISLRNLYLTYIRHEQHRSGILLIAFGIVIFAITVTLFGVILPLMGNFNFLDFSTLGAVFPLMFFSYAITKHDFLDISVIINKTAAWLITLLIVVGTFAISHNYTLNDHPILGFLANVSIGIFWCFYAMPLQQLLLTTAKRKFIRGWYEPGDIINRLSESVTSEENRQAIFLGMEKVFDEVLELERSHVVVAVRDNEEQLSHYRFLTRSNIPEAKTLPTDHPIVSQFSSERAPLCLEDCEADTKQFLLQQGYLDDQRCLLVAFHSPELLEGIVILGERSNQSSYEEADKRFFKYIINYMSAIFYRLTPMEKLERSYLDNVQRLHEAEIQLIRAQKIESIVHATRQCHHEIRTPLNIIQLNIGRLKTLEDLEEFKKVAKEEIRHALEIIEETLIISDVEQPTPSRETEVNLTEVIRRSQKLIPTDRFTVHTQLPEQLLVRGVFSDLQVVFTNLAHNAMDAMPNGGTISITGQRNGNQIVVEFSDNGEGIPAEVRERVWEPYFSGHNTTLVGNSTAGRGWGLTIINRIINEHAGTISLSSTLGQGTTFTIKLTTSSAESELSSSSEPQDSADR